MHTVSFHQPAFCFAKLPAFGSTDIGRASTDLNFRPDVHTGITCNSCNAYPIRGIRYRCTNCVDYDLCEVCEAQQAHPKTHLFYKVRIPRSRLGHQPQPLKYPGKYRPFRRLKREVFESLAQGTVFSTIEVEGLWEQFRCLASADWPADPFHYCVAIDRCAFEQLVFPTDSPRPLGPNLIYERLFSFFDTDENDLIGFNEFLDGLSNLRNKSPTEKFKRIFKAFDLDSDGE